MHISTNALVLRVQGTRESDRLCTLLTEEHGIVRAFARGAKNIKNKNFSATAQFSYGHFVLYCAKDKYVINEAALERTFVPLRDDIERLALAQYVCELCIELAPPDENSRDFLQLTMAALHHLSGSIRPAALIKAAAEMRMLALSGYMPDLIMCGGCGAFEADTMLFSPMSGNICCTDCAAMNSDLRIPLGRGAVAAMRHTVYAELKKLFSFELVQPSLGQLCTASEAYLKTQLDRSFNTLDFYNSIISKV